MKKIYSLIISSTLLLNGCGIFGGGEDTATIPEIPKPTPPPIPEVTETPDNNPVIGSTGGLIPSTNAQDRLRQIEQGRNDPFKSINPPAVIKIRQDQPIPVAQTDRAIVITPLPTAIEPSTQIAQNPSTQGARNIDVIVANGKNGSAPSTVIDITKVQGTAPIIPPSPTEASNMIVSGVMTLDGNNIALIQAPWDTITQSVRVGDVISDGNVSVRVREIRFNYPTSIALTEDNQTVYRNIGNDQGFVVFEQYGQRVTKEVGSINQESDEVAKL